MTEEKTKTRQRLTLTAMYSALYDLHFAVIGPDLAMRQDPPVLETTMKKVEGGFTFVVGLFARVSEEPFVAGTLIEEAGHPDGIEEAVSVLLSKMQEKFEAKRKEVLSGLDSVVSRHHGALRGARSKIREKKT